MNFKNRYQFDPQKDFVGKGGFSRVYKAFDTVRKRIVALKFYNSSESNKYDVISEINRMENIVHPNLIRYYDATFFDTVNALGEKEQMQVGIMEYANAGDISIFFKQQQSEELTLNIVLDILKGIQFLHNNGIAHRDLKPKNILLSEENGILSAKIADFGISKKVEADDASVSSQILGSIEYMAPEQLAPAIYGIAGKLETNADLWSFGIILYEIFTNRLPFGSRTKGINYEQILNNILFQDAEIDYGNIPEPYRSVIERCLIKNAKQRARRAEELFAILTGKSYKDPKAQDNTAPPETEQTDKQQENSLTAVMNVDKKNDKQETPNNQQTDTTPFTHEPRDPHRENRDTPPRPLLESSKAVLNELNVGKNLFKLGNYPESFKILDRYQNYDAFDTEARFYLGFMYYNGKCGGTHDPERGKQLMNEAKAQNHALIIDLMVKYVLKKS